ncbi:cytochrome P450, partial [Neoconidiobolus thromboides FSU 785]
YLNLKDYLSLDKFIIYSLLLWVAYTAYNVYSTKDEPPMVPHLPIIGHTLQLRNNPRRFLLECQKKYGDIFGVNFLGKKIFVFTNKASEYLAKAHDMGIVEGRDKIFFISEVLGEGKDSPGKPDQILDNVAIVKEEITPMLKTMLPEVLKTMNRVIQEEIGEGTGPEGINIEYFFSNVIANSVAVLLLGPELSKDKDLIFLLRDYANKIDKCLRKGLLWHLVPFIGSYIVNYKIKYGNPSVSEREFIYSRIEKHIQNRRQKIKGGEEVEAKGLVDTLSDKGHNISQISQAIMVLGFASISTTTRSSSLLITDLLAHPENFAILREEQKRITEHVEKDATGSPLLSKEDIDKFSNLNSAIRETLRHRSYHLEAWRLTHIDRILPNGMKISKGS